MQFRMTKHCNHIPNSARDYHFHSDYKEQMEYPGRWKYDSAIDPNGMRSF